MSRKKKEFKQSATFALAPAGKPESFIDSLRSLVNGLFGSKKIKYKPTQREVADYYLTSREREIAYLAALGFSPHEIADALGMNFQTVKVHLRHALNKMELDDPRDLREFFAPPDRDSYD